MGSIHRPDAFPAAIDPALVQSLARDYDQEEAQAERILREEILRIAAGARINTFVTVLAVGRARVRLRELQAETA